jgi:hypothetical protein
VPVSASPSGRGKATGSSAASAATAELLASRVRAALARTVRASSIRQAASGLLAAGPGKAAAYVGAKLRKLLLGAAWSRASGRS